jgi:hypothetical protein
MTGQPRQDSQDRTARMGQLEDNIHDDHARQPGYGNQYRAAKQNRLTKKGQPKQVSEDKTAKKKRKK